MSAALPAHRFRQPQNPALVPGSLLSRRALWQQVADSLPAGDVLVVLPSEEGPQRRALTSAALFLQAAGHHVTTLGAETFAAPGIQAHLALG